MKGPRSGSISMKPSHNIPGFYKYSHHTQGEEVSLQHHETPPQHLQNTDVSDHKTSLPWHLKLQPLAEDKLHSIHDLELLTITNHHQVIG
jgi:hypothetical protein